VSDDNTPAPPPLPPTGPAPHPAPVGLSFYQGQPIDPAGAAAQLDTLRADPKWMARIAAKDPEAFAENTRLWRISRGMTAEPGPETVIDVYQQHADRGVQAAESHADAIEKRQLFEVIMQRPVQQFEREKAERDYQKAVADKGYMEKWRNGDRQARTEMYLLNAIRAAPVATQQQVLAWDAAHPFNEEMGMGNG
jgi:hypothetical protein